MPRHGAMAATPPLRCEARLFCEPGALEMALGPAPTAVGDTVVVLAMVAAPVRDPVVTLVLLFVPSAKGGGGGASAAGGGASTTGGGGGAPAIAPPPAMDIDIGGGKLVVVVALTTAAAPVRDVLLMPETTPSVPLAMVPMTPRVPLAVVPAQHSQVCQTRQQHHTACFLQIMHSAADCKVLSCSLNMTVLPDVVDQTVPGFVIPLYTSHCLEHDCVTIDQF